MSVVRRLRATLGSRAPYTCTLCGLTFETERANCAACGSSVRDTY